jgi:hypothetical protein
VRGSLIGVIVIAGCYQPSFPTGAPCTVTDECPGGQMCVGGICGGLATDAAPSILDRDRDGIADDRDSCPDAPNLDQANDDGDPFGDACDPCPQVADGAGTDGDGDRIGDLCDPNPGVQDTVWLYEGFFSGALPPWSRSLRWTVVGDQLRVMATGDTGSDSEYLFTPFTAATPPDNFSVTVIALAEQMTGTSGDHELGIDILNADDRAVYCWLAQSAGGANPTLRITDDLGRLAKSAPFAWTTKAEYRFTMTRHGSTYTCTVVGPEGTQTVSGTSTVAPVTGDAVDLWAYGVTALVDSVQIIGAP